MVQQTDAIILKLWRLACVEGLDNTDWLALMEVVRVRVEHEWEHHGRKRPYPARVRLEPELQDGIAELFDRDCPPGTRAFAVIGVIPDEKHVRVTLSPQYTA